MSEPAEFCPYCKIAARVVRKRRRVPVGQRQVRVDDEWMRCKTCNEEFYTPAQADALDRKSIEQVRTEDGLLTPNAIKKIRSDLGLSQREFEHLLGTGEKTCVRWETGRVSQSVAADRLMRLIARNPDNARHLATLSRIG